MAVAVTNSRFCRSRCFHENGTKMAREPENCQKVARDCQRALYCPKTTCDDVRSVVLVETLLYNEFVTCQPNVTPVTSQV